MLTTDQRRAGLAAVSRLTEGSGKSIKAEPETWVEAIGQAVLGASAGELSDAEREALALADDWRADGRHAQTLATAVRRLLVGLPPKPRWCDEGHTLEWRARDLMDATNAYQRKPTGDNSRWMQDAADRVQAVLRRTLRKPGAAQLRGLWTIRHAAGSLADEIGTEEGRAAEARDIRAGLGWLVRAIEGPGNG